MLTSWIRTLTINTLVISLVISHLLVVVPTARGVVYTTLRAAIEKRTEATAGTVTGCSNDTEFSAMVTEGHDRFQLWRHNHRHGKHQNRGMDRWPGCGLACARYDLHAAPATRVCASLIA